MNAPKSSRPAGKEPRLLAELPATFDWQSRVVRGKRRRFEARGPITDQMIFEPGRR